VLTTEISCDEMSSAFLTVGTETVRATSSAYV